MDNQEREDLNKIRHYKGTVKDFKNYWDEMAGTETNAFGTPEYQGFNEVHPTRGANDSEHWKTSNVTEDTDIGHVDNEPGMLGNDLEVIGRYAAELGEMMKQLEMQGEVDLPHWWQSKVILAKEYLVKAKHYLRSELEGGISEHWKTSNVTEGRKTTDGLGKEGMQIYRDLDLEIGLDDPKYTIRNYKDIEPAMKDHKLFKKLTPREARILSNALSNLMRIAIRMER